jgi:O-acetyl-ADP-ribose deacetylase (regulator of RNase III)
MTSFEHVYKNVKVRIISGDITKLKVDAIVNPANTFLYMGGGVAGAIKRAGGTEIEAEALKKAPVKVGEAIATNAGKLPAKFVIHAPTMTCPAMRINEKNVQLAMQGALKCAQSLKISSLAFPGLGTGVGGLSMETAANVMMGELKKHLDESTSLKEVVFVGFGSEAAEKFEEAFLNVFGSVG